MLLDESKERYEFTWPDKRKAIINSNTPTTNTLRPCKEESVNFDTTENLYIEGDNLEVLKLLQKTYLGKVKMIYIDPPYNTGNDFIYQDNFKQSKDEYNEQSSDYDDDGNRLVSNPSSNGRFHTDWLNMIYPRLKLARDLLTDDGVIFISIDDNEQANLKKVCDEIFGADNFIENCIRLSKRTSDKGTFFKPTKDYLLVYAKNLKVIDWKFGVEVEISEDEYKYEDEHGKYKKNGASLYQPSLDSRPNQRYYIECPDGSFIIPPGTVFPSELKDGAQCTPKSNADKCWRWSRDTYLKNKDRLIFTKASNNCPLIDSNGRQAEYNIYDKVYLNEKEGTTLLPEDIVYDYLNSHATKELIELGISFSFSKPSGLIKYLIKLCRFPDSSLILDFFSGSATTAHAVMKLNAEDGGNRKFIMVQLPDVCAETSEAYKAGYKNICEIGKERIRRAGQKIKDESPLTTQNLDVGFRVLKVDSSNMKDVFYKPNEVTGDIFDNAINNIKEDRTGEDLLFQVLLDMGISLSSKIEKKKIKNKEVFYVYAEDEKFLIASFDRTLNDDVVTEIAKEKPQYFVMRDTDDDKVRINFEQIFKAYSPDTTRKVL